MIFITVVFMSFGLSGMGASSMGEVLGEGCWDQVRECLEGCWLQACAVRKVGTFCFDLYGFGACLCVWTPWEVTFGRSPLGVNLQGIWWGSTGVERWPTKTSWTRFQTYLPNWLTVVLAVVCFRGGSCRANVFDIL